MDFFARLTSAIFNRILSQFQCERKESVTTDYSRPAIQSHKGFRSSSSSANPRLPPEFNALKVLDELDEASHRQYLITNGNIAQGKNPHIKFGKNGGFTLSTPKQEESDAEPLQRF